MDQRASQACSSLICATIAFVFGFLATIAGVVLIVYKVKEMKKEEDY